MIYLKLLLATSALLLSGCVVTPVKYSSLTTNSDIKQALPFDISAQVYVATPYVDEESESTIKMTKHQAYKSIGPLTKMKQSSIEIAKKYFKSASAFDPSSKSNLYIFLTGRFTMERIVGSLTANIKGRVYDSNGNIIFESESSDTEVTGIRFLNEATLHNAIAKAQMGFYDKLFLTTSDVIKNAALVNGSGINNIYKKLSQNETRELSTASGFLFNSKGNIITNYHTIESCMKINVELNNKKRDAKVIYADKELDLAVLETDIRKKQYAHFADKSYKVRLGEDVVVVGFPLQGVLSSNLSLTKGNVSALAGINDDEKLFQFTAPVQAGNSGGPMLNNRGHVIGVVQSKLNALKIANYTGDFPQNVNFSIKYNNVLDFLNKNNISYKSNKKTKVKNTPDIADEAKKYLIKLTCIGYVDVINHISNKEPEPFKDDNS